MVSKRAQGTVCLLLGVETDRERLVSFLEKAGYHVHAFKNPVVFFDAVQEHKPFAVVLETAALKTKLSEWVSQLQTISDDIPWITMATMSQYPILASYQNRGLAEIVTMDALYYRERLVWALDRELDKHLLKKQLRDMDKVRSLEFVEDSGMKPAASMLSETPEKTFDIGTLVELRFQDAKQRQRPFLMGVLTLDDPQEIQSFWGVEVLRQVKELLQNKIRETWGATNFASQDDNNFVLVNATTPDFLSDVQVLQSQLQEQGRSQFGFRISISGGVSQAFVHARTSEDMRRLCLEACRHMSSKGGGRVGIPRPLQADPGGKGGPAQGGHGGNVPQNMG